MGNKYLYFCIGGLAGFGLGLFVGKCECDRLEIERDELDLRNKCLAAEYEIAKLYGDNLKETNEILTNLLLREKKNEEP